MEFIKIYPSKDSFISKKNPSNNYGIDAILELSTTSATANLESTRILTYFDLSNVISNLTSSYTATLNFYNARNSKFTDENFNVEIYPLTANWNEGLGSKLYPISSSVNYLSATTINSWSSSGGDYTASPSASITFQNGTENLTSNLSAFINYWSTSTNYGLLLKFPDSIESLTSTYQNNKSFFSKDTHTLFKPSINITYNSSLITDDRNNLHLGNNTIFFYDRNVGTTSYPGVALMTMDLTVTGLTAFAMNYFAPSTWYINFNATSLFYPELWTVLSNTASNYSITSSVTGFRKYTHFANDISRLSANIISRPEYFQNESPIFRVKVFDYVYVGMGSVAEDYFPNSVSIFFIEQNTRTIVTPEIPMNYDEDGYWIKNIMSNFLPSFYYIPVIKIYDGVNNEFIYREIKESKFFVKKFSNQF